MGEKAPPSAATLLPPGCRFYPSDEQLLSHYLSSKNTKSNPNSINIIKEINLYNFEPFNLPEAACFRYGRGASRRHWFCFVAARDARGRGGRRPAAAGYWKPRGRLRNVLCAAPGSLVLGTRKTFVFYVGFHDSKMDVRTDWFMYEYALLPNHPKASFVLCRVFIKSHQLNNLLEPVLSCRAEETVATVRHIGIQHGGTVKSAIAEAKADDEFPADCSNGGSNCSMRFISELDDLVSNQPHSEQVSLDNALTAQELVAILEDDFIELDDLVSPLPGID